MDLFGAESITGVIARHMTTNAAEVVNANRAIPPHLRNVLLTTLEENREKRVRSVKEILESLSVRRMPQHELPTVEMDRPEPPKTESDPAIAKRKARLKSLLDEM